jgi:hypothetical protein
MIKLQEQKLKLLSDFDTLRVNLPFGLRPSVTSVTNLSVDAVDD